MKTAIIYQSKHGTTAKVAAMIAEMLSPDEISLFHLKEDKIPDLEEFDRIVMGSSVYAGSVSKPFKRFCTDINLRQYASKDLGLFICGMMQDPKKQHEELEEAFPERVRRHAKVRAFLGGEFLFERMNFFERFIIRKMFKINSSVSRIDMERVQEFVKKLKE